MDSNMKANNFWGIVNYEIIGDGCLNGIWTNNDVNRGGIIMNEIARMKTYIDDTIIGEYSVAWIEPNKQPTTGTLAITKKGEELHFNWKNNNKSIFNGIGLKLGLNNIIVFYWKSGDSFCI